MPDRVLITCRQMQDCIDVFRHRFQQHGVELSLPPVPGQQLSESELIPLVADVTGIIAGDDLFSRQVIEHAPRLRVIAKWGIGLDGIDQAAAREHGVVVNNTPGVFSDDVADVAVGYVVVIARQLHRMHESVGGGEWLKVRGQRLAGQTLGIAGFGGIGQAVARRALGFGMSVLAYDIVADAAVAAAHGVELVDREGLFRRSRFLVLCAPLTPETRHIVSRRTLELMPRGSYIVNVARGPLVDESALAAALRSGQLAAAALDVFESEPLPESSELRAFSQCVFGSHNGSNTTEGTLQASEQAVTNVLRELGYH